MNGQTIPGSLKVGRVAGIDVKIHVTFILYIVFVLATSKSIQIDLIILTLLFGSVLLHEFGHCLGAWLVKGSADEIILWPLGGLALLRYPNNAKSELVSTAAGPAVNLVLWGLAWLLVYTGAVQPVVGAEAAGPVSWWVFYLGWINLVLFVFNVIPAYPMDGGRLLRSMLWPLLQWKRATLTATVTGMLCGAAFVVAAFAYFKNPILGLIGALVTYESYREFKRARAFVPSPEQWHGDDRMPHERP